jgi:hypothetical protein
MELYVCYGTLGPSHRHACARAYRALASAGYRPRIRKTYDCYGTDRFFRGRREIKDLTGTYKVPTLVLRDGSFIDGSENIVVWAAANHQDPD